MIISKANKLQKKLDKASKKYTMFEQKRFQVCIINGISASDAVDHYKRIAQEAIDALRDKKI